MLMLRDELDVFTAALA